MKEHNLDRKPSDAAFAFLTTDQSEKDTHPRSNQGTTNASDPHTYGNSMIHSSILPKQNNDILDHRKIFHDELTPRSGQPVKPPPNVTDFGNSARFGGI